MSVERFPIEASHVMMFARSIGDPNPIYYDADYAAKSEVGAIAAPPTFVQASAQFDPDYFLRPKVGEPWFGSGKNATGLPPKKEAGGGGGGGGGLHAEQHFEYHRPIRIGETLTVTSEPGKTWEREGRTGTLKFAERITHYRDAGGNDVVTGRSVSVQVFRKDS